LCLRSITCFFFSLTPDSWPQAFMVALRDPSKMFKITDSGMPT
jgi:hypothetical protein